MNCFEYPCLTPDDFKKPYLYYWYNWLTDKISSIVEIDGLEKIDTISTDYFYRILFTTGRIAFFKNGNDLLAYFFTPTGKFDIYYRTKEIIITFANGEIINKQNFTRNIDCTLVYAKKSDNLNVGYGFHYDILRTANILSDIDISLLTALENSRLTAVAECMTDNDKIALNEIFAKMRKGDRVIATKGNIIDKINVNKLSENTNIDMIKYTDLQKYYLAEFFQNCGINAFKNFKKAQQTEIEITNDEEFVNLSFDNTINTINDGLAKTNELFGTNLHAKLKDFSEIDRTLKNILGVAKNDYNNI